MTKTYLELVEGTSSKFWEIEINGTEYSVRYGRIGTDGRSSTKSFASEEETQKQATKAIESKRKKGYQEPAVATPAGEATTVDEMIERFPELDEVGGVDVIEAATIYHGDVVLDQDGLMSLALEQAEEGTLVVIDGNLTCTASSVEWEGEHEFANNAVLVTGQVTLNNLYLNDIGTLIVKGDMVAKNILVNYGDNGGCLDIHGALTAEVIIATTYFMVEIQGKVTVKHIIGDGTYATDFASGFEVIDTEEDANVFVDELSEDGDVEDYEIYERLVAGSPIFVNDGKPRDGAYDKQW